MLRMLLGVIIAGLAWPGCGGLTTECLQRQKTAQYVANVANTQLYMGMTREAAHRVLGDPTETIRYAGKEAWKYYVWEDCQLHQGISAPTTEAVFVDGRLQMWLTYGR